MYDTLLVGVDGSDAAAAALREAIDFARIHDATVHAIHVIETQPRQYTFSIDDIDELNTAAMELLDTVVEGDPESSLTVEREIRRGSPEAVIQDYAAEIDVDVIVVGKRGTAGIERVLLGSTADRLARMADRPLWIIPAQNAAETGS